MNIIVTTKQVPDLVEDLEVNAEGTALDPDECDFKLNEWDDHALEEALCIKESSGGTVTVVAMDGDGVDKVLFTALAKGADRAVKITGVEFEEVESNYSLAKAYAEAIGQLSPELVLCGVQGPEDRDGQFGPILSALLGMPCVSVATHVAVSGNTVSLAKEYAGGLMARFEVTTPAILGIQAARQTPRYVAVSKVRQTQQSASIDEIEVDEPPSALAAVSSMAPPVKTGGATMLANVEALAGILREKGVM
jgi:electron transfer flavoprotein beta subunit